MKMIDQNAHFISLLKEIVRPYQPVVSHDEAELLLRSNNGNIIGFGTPLSAIAELNSETVCSYLFELLWVKNGETLQDVIDQYNCPQEWGPEINEDPRFMFVHRLQQHRPLEAVSLYLATCEWWEVARRSTDNSADYRDFPHLALHRFFNIQG